MIIYLHLKILDCVSEDEDQLYDDLSVDYYFLFCTNVTNWNDDDNDDEISENYVSPKKENMQQTSMSTRHGLGAPLVVDSVLAESKGASSESRGCALPRRKSTRN
ncbi:hypothetical protein BLOT_000306 [Blomia tropicalis]|nr:hypothetical protein BLOT_000306 [Blomia tropicalis]